MNVVRRMIVPVAWMALLWGLSSLPSTAEHELLGVRIAPALQNGAHLVAYGVLAAAWFWALSPCVAGAAAWSFALAVAYGGADELHQAFIPGRTSSVLDLLTNAAGAAIALWLLATVARRHTPSMSRPETQP